MDDEREALWAQFDRLGDAYREHVARKEWRSAANSAWLAAAMLRALDSAAIGIWQELAESADALADVLGQREG